MPLVRIDVPDELPPARAAGLSAAVHDALVACCDVPADDRFHVVSRHGAGGLVVDRQFLGIARGPEASIVSITFRKGRSDEAKRALYRTAARGRDDRPLREHARRLELRQRHRPIRAVRRQPFVRHKIMSITG